MKSRITEHLVNIAIKHARDRCPEGWDERDIESYALLSLVKRAKRYSGINQFEPYVVHYMKKDVTDYLRTQFRRRKDWVDINEDTGMYEPKKSEVDELISWVDNEAGYPLATWLSQGYKGYEVAEMAGVSPARVSIQRKELYARARATGIC